MPVHLFNKKRTEITNIPLSTVVNFVNNKISGQGVHLLISDDLGSFL